MNEQEILALRNRVARQQIVTNLSIIMLGASILFGVFGRPRATNAAPWRSDDAPVPTHLVVQTLTVKSPDSPYSVTITANKGAAGLWVHDAEHHNHQAGVYVARGQGPALTVRGDDTLGRDVQFGGDNIAISTVNGPTIQVAGKDGKLVFGDLVGIAGGKTKVPPVK